MRCGSKCFFVKMEVDGEEKTESVLARTPASARKTIRNEYGRESIILSVQQE